MRRYPHSDLFQIREFWTAMDSAFSEILFSYWEGAFISIEMFNWNTVLNKMPTIVGRLERQNEGRLGFFYKTLRYPEEKHVRMLFRCHAAVQWYDRLSVTDPYGEAVYTARTIGEAFHRVYHHGPTEVISDVEDQSILIRHFKS